MLALVPALILPLIFLLLPELLYSAAAQMDNAHQQAMLKTSIDSADLSYRLLTIGAAVATTGLLLLNRIPLWQRLVAAGLIQALLLAWAVLPLLAKIQQQPIKDAAVIAAERSAPLVLWKAHLPSFVTYTSDRCNAAHQNLGTWCLPGYSTNLSWPPTKCCSAPMVSCWCKCSSTPTTMYPH